VTTEDASTWKRCNTCKKPIAFATDYFTCNVSTCNRKGTDFAFCSVSCWDAHVPVLSYGAALLLSGIGFIVLALGALRPATTAAKKSAPGTVPVTA